MMRRKAIIFACFDFTDFLHIRDAQIKELTAVPVTHYQNSEILDEFRKRNRKWLICFVMSVLI